MYRGDIGINAINARIQDEINPLDETVGEIKYYGNIFRENDKVIQLVNRAEKGIMNGDVGYISHFKYKNLKILIGEDTDEELYKMNEDEFDAYVYIGGSIFMEGGKVYNLSEKFFDFVNRCKNYF